MRWFHDVWMKEVFANFMAAKIVNPSFPAINHDLRFLLDYYPLAYDIDRTDGSNPIRQPLANLNEAGTLYGNIIYDKAPIVMRQLERLVGADVFRDGLRDLTASRSRTPRGPISSALDDRTRTMPRGATRGSTRSTAGHHHKLSVTSGRIRVWR
jgi:aminopeptidase N